ncbi:phage holin [Salibacterium halotolerans]|uniref:Holin, SPP1 family n=1 Tax=Salibacterium halotolerans TaxID=1884432 RepID=A0A1I5MS72_9BACI|nr:phage holin [Salibacterium halotolerans]SFP11826.1 holin, SPP1 family [Salibacterium halotolerans]
MIQFFKGLDAGTVTRTIIMVVAFINQGLAIFGQSPLPIDEQNLELFVSFIFSAVTAVIAWWKNNNFTKEAKWAQEYLESKKQ